MCASSPTAATGPRPPTKSTLSPQDSGRGGEPCRRAGDGILAAATWAPTRAATAHDRAADPAAVHRPGDLPALVRGSGQARQSRERDDHAGIPRPGSEKPADRRATPTAGRRGDAVAG